MNGPNILRLIYPAIGIALIIAVWHFYIVEFDIPPVVLPLPGDVVIAMIEDWHDLFTEAWITFLECVFGFALAVAIGMPIAVMVTSSSTLNQMFYPLLIAVQSVPKVAIAPITMVWFGYGIESKLAIVFMVAFFPMVIDTATGLRSTPQDLIDLARALRCTRFQIFWKIQLPWAMPFVFSGAKVAVTLAVIGAVVGEFVGAEAGLGKLLLVANSQINPPLVWASLVFLSVLGMLMFAAVVVAERIFMPWAADTGHG